MHKNKNNEFFLTKKKENICNLRRSHEIKGKVADTRVEMGFRDGRFLRAGPVAGRCSEKHVEL